MPLVSPQFIVLDTATLVKASRDYWSPNESLREKARTFIARLRDSGVYITFTLTHVLELLRHQDDSVVRDRLKFLQRLPFIAWLRPYDRNWFPGGISTLLRRELHAVVHDAKRDWRAIIDHVRIDLLETGVGAEMFVDDDHLWSTLRTEAQRDQQNDRYVASITRTDLGNIDSLTLAEARKMPKRTKAERHEFMQRFAAIIHMQLEQHGDRRLEDPQGAAFDFANRTVKHVDELEAAGGDLYEQLLKYRGIPQEFVTDDMTFGDIRNLIEYKGHLAILSESLDPPATVTVRDVPPETLPSYVVERRLAGIQRKATRVSGSDLGDGYIAPLTLYADGVEVDKRTYEYLTQMKRDCPAIAGVLGHFFRSADYAEIPDRLGRVA
ncbi:MAG: hypothetical protein DWQ31_08670 [Planctomycetota bacterium]|nr:MAG: hypothetical protein DWQ31_08670 [Planctomycetota bacterium]REJ86935.1 MAG: hypothetical protein DWQ35_22500 [Planctomycetota bacterium]REK24938.1 MAG: hypothetical protein DWQ42_12670 [Planctomycetota bacterium]REK48527.1 MAG: hypothetical protein DWQ46_02200 [Planctomycetota bacterium]